MKQLNDPNHPLASLGAYNQWVCWQLVDRPGQTKPAKVTIDPATGEYIDPHDPSNWMTLEQALTWRAALGHGVGFVLTANDPFFFLDLDGCSENGQWNQLAQSVCAMFPGAAVEISQSGTGLHVFGCGKVPEGYKKRNDRIGVELYTDKRFAAINPDSPTVGNAWLDWTSTLNTFVPSYLEQDTTAVDANWTTVPREDWDGPEDDDELIERMTKSKGGAAGLFGGKATLAQLWQGDPNVLAEFFPDASGNRPCDLSAADAALSSHLAFWTGANCERMERLMRRSGLRRDKWDQHRSYLHRTVLGAASRCDKVYKQRRSAATVGEGGNGPITPESSEWLTPEEQMIHFHGCVYIMGQHMMFTPKGTFLRPEAFNSSEWAGHNFQLDPAGESKTDKAFTAFTQSRAVRFPKVDSVCFRPELPPGHIFQEEGFTLLNTYVPAPIRREQGDASRFVEHVKKLFPDDRDREIVMSYMAACVQYPGTKFQWCPVIQGGEGNGKSLLMRCVAKAVGERYTHIKEASDLTGSGTKFNAWIENKLFVGFDEIRTADRRDVIEALKPLVTNPRIEIQGKGQNQFTGDNRANLMMTSNHKDAVAKTKSDRRYAVFYTPQQDKEDCERDGMGGAYFPDLYGWLKGNNEYGYAVVAHFLATYGIAEEFNPAYLCHRAPETSVTNEAIVESMGTVEQEVIEHIESGQKGMKNGWVSSTVLDTVLQDTGMARRMPRNKRKEMLRSLGYVPHPHLPGGRTTVELFDEKNSRPVLYVKQDSIQSQITDPKQICDTYKRAQGYAVDRAEKVG